MLLKTFRKPHPGKRSAALAVLYAAALLLIAALPVRATEVFPFSVSKPAAVTSGPEHHFFGYYEITPWDASGRYMLSLETDFHNRMPGPGDAAAIGLIDTETRDFKPVAKTLSWNLQQGAMQQWLPSAPDRKIIYNDRRGGGLVAVVLDLVTGKERVLPRPISDVSRDGKKALSLNYARLARLYPVTGYPGLKDPTEGVPQPADDGIFLMDLESGAVKLLVSVADVAAAYMGPVDLPGKEIWLSHTGFNPSGTRFYFLVRFPKGLTWDTAMFTADTGGKNLRCVVEFGQGVSHFGWQSDTRLLATMKRAEPGGRNYEHVLFDDTAKPVYERIAGDVLTDDGHPGFSPDGRWLLTDTYPGPGMKQRLYVVDMETGKAYEIAAFRHSPKFTGPARCDLHPRWNRTGNRISVDSIDSGSRQVYVLDFDAKPGATR